MCIKKVRGTTPSLKVKPKIGASALHYGMANIGILFNIIKYCSDSFVGMFLHYGNVVEDWSVFLHGLSDAIFQCGKRYAKIETMLNERLSCRV